VGRCVFYVFPMVAFFMFQCVVVLFTHSVLRIRQGWETDSLKSVKASIMSIVSELKGTTPWCAKAVQLFQALEKLEAGHSDKLDGNLTLPSFKIRIGSAPSLIRTPASSSQDSSEILTDFSWMSDEWIEHVDLAGWSELF